MEWRGQGILLSVRRHGESSAIIEVFTPEHGLHAGIVRGGASRRMAPVLQPGAQLDVTWKARLSEHLGSYTVEPVRSRAAQTLGDRFALAGLNAVTGLLLFALPEREVVTPLYHRVEQLLDLLGQHEIWPLAYLRFEMALLDAVGMGLDLSACAATGRTDDLCFVSPKSGRAVSREGAGIWADKLLPLPAVLLGQGSAPDEEVRDGLRTTGYFLREKLAVELGGRALPDARGRFLDLFERRITKP